MQTRPAQRTRLRTLVHCCRQPQRQRHPCHPDHLTPSPPPAHCTLLSVFSLPLCFPPFSLPHPYACPATQVALKVLFPPTSSPPQLIAVITRKQRGMGRLCRLQTSPNCESNKDEIGQRANRERAKCERKQGGRNSREGGDKEGGCSRWAGQDGQGPEGAPG